MFFADHRSLGLSNRRLTGLARCTIVGLLACPLLQACSQTMVDYDDGRAELVFAGVKVKRFHQDRGRFPAELAELLQPSSHGMPYTSALPVDRYGRTVLYAPPTVLGQPAKLGSLGRDGRVGGEGEDLDLWIDVD